MHRSSGISGTLKDLRSKAAALAKEQAGIAVLANLPGRLSPSQIAEQLANIDSINNHKELKSVVSNLRSAVDQLRAELGVNISREKLFALMGWIHHSIEPTQACYMPAGMLAENISMYGKMNLPPHARISLDLQCLNRDYPGGFEIRMLEASLYEDMCALFNLLQRSRKDIPAMQPAGAMDRKIPAKRHAALMRATLSASYYFVEAYINCLATDYLHKHASHMNEKDRMLLTEWDSVKRRHRFVSTRDKLVQYPRIVTASAFPPIDENTYPELHYLVTTAKDFRDALVHASASFDPMEGYPKKERLFIDLKHDVAKVVDASISVVRRIETLVSGRPQPWLRDRGEDGLFPDEAFE